MDCIWCQKNSDHSKSIEHILPESLGNTEYTLPKGWVCDSCNSYFAKKIEYPFLNSYYCKFIRYQMNIPNKKGNMPRVPALLLGHKYPIEIIKNKGSNSLTLSTENLNQKKRQETEEFLQTKKKGTFIIKDANLPDNDRILSRFIAKVGLEILAYKVICVDQSNKNIVSQPELNEIRKYVRYGEPIELVWPINIRTIYPANHSFLYEDEESHEVLNEWNILVTSKSEYYAVIIIFGVEYVINIGGPTIDGYLQWLNEHKNISPLYLEDQYFSFP